MIGQHRIERLIGRGGIAEVYLATETTFEVRQALKVMVADDADWARRLVREGRAQYLVQHPNLVRVLGSLSVLGRPALIMEYVHGSDLRRWLRALRDRGRWPAPVQALEIFRGVLAGVGAVHARGLVHRDLKPANILVELSDGGVVPKVTDFGLVKDVLGQRTPGEVTVAGTIMGTQGYIAPEQIWALSEIDARADVFALGCILYLLLCKHGAFADVDTSVTFAKVLNEEYTDPREHVPDMLESLYLALRYSLVSDRRERIPSCEALWDVIQRGRPALVELGLATDVEAFPSAPPPIAAVGASGMQDVDTTGRPLAEVKTVAMSAELLEPVKTEDVETQESPREVTDALLELDSVSASPAPVAQPTSPSVAQERPTVAEPAPEPPAAQPRPTVAEPAPLPPPRARPRPVRGSGLRMAVIAVLALGLGTVAAAGVGLLIWVRLPEHAPGTISPPAPEVPEDPGPAPEPDESGSLGQMLQVEPFSEPLADPVEPAPLPEPAPAVGSETRQPPRQPAVAPEPVPMARVEPAPTPVAMPPSAPPVEPEQPMGRVVVEGTAQRVCLRSQSDGVEHCAAKVPAGRYDVLIYVGDDAVSAGTTQVREGETTGLRCDAAFMTCY